MTLSKGVNRRACWIVCGSGDLIDGLMGAIWILHYRPNGQMGSFCKQFKQCDKPTHTTFLSLDIKARLWEPEHQSSYNLPNRCVGEGVSVGFTSFFVLAVTVSMLSERVERSREFT